MMMARDRAAEISAPAAVALARLGNREVLPILLDMLTDPNDVKGRAAVGGLIILGGEDVVEQMRSMSAKAESLSKFRMAIVLNGLNDPLGPRAAAQGVPGGAVPSPGSPRWRWRGGATPTGCSTCGDKLDERFDITKENYIFRAKAAGALIEGGDRWAVTVLQDALRQEDPEIQMATCEVISDTGQRFLLPSLQPAIESRHPAVAWMASLAALSVADAEFHNRVTDPTSIDYEGVMINTESLL
jgi:HEAT repeat protein